MSKVFTRIKRDIIKLPNDQINGKYEYQVMKKVKNKDGVVHERAKLSLNYERLADVCIQAYQDSELNKQFNYNALRAESIKKLTPKFQKHGLVVLDGMSKKEAGLIRKKQEIAIDQDIREHIENNSALSVYIDFDEFIEATNIKTAQIRTGYAMKLLLEAQHRSFYEFTRPVISDDFQELSYELTSVSAMPAITIEVDESVYSEYGIRSISEFIDDTRIKNKRQLIKSVRLDANKTFISSVIGVGRNFTPNSRKTRSLFKSVYAYRLFWVVSSIYKVQYIKDKNYFTFGEIQDVFGTSYTVYRSFKSRVLIPSIEDINKYTELSIELIEHKKHNAVVGVSFSIKSKGSIGSTPKKFGVDAVAYYIASRLFYFTKQNIKDLIAFGKYIEKEQSGFYGEKSYEEWEVEALEALEAEKSIEKYFEDHKNYLKSLDLFYDSKRMTIVKILEEEGSDFDGNEVKRTVSIIKTEKYKVDDPIKSLHYLGQVLEEQQSETPSIIDFIPFSLAKEDGRWVAINSVESCVANIERLRYVVYQKNMDCIRFPDDSLFARMFYKTMQFGSFKEVAQDSFREMMNKLEDKIISN